MPFQVGDSYPERYNMYIYIYIYMKLASVNFITINKGD